MDKVRVVRKRGRPFGHCLSEETKEKIRQKRLGTRHSIETRNKISKSLKSYFRRKNSLAGSLKSEYADVDYEVMEWFDLNKESLDSIDDVMTFKKLVNLSQLEVGFGLEIEDLFGHEMTPEFLLLLKEYCHRLDT